MGIRKKSAGPRQRLPLSEEKRKAIKFSGREDNREEIPFRRKSREESSPGRRSDERSPRPVRFSVERAAKPSRPFGDKYERKERPERESSDRPFRDKTPRPERESSDRPFRSKPARPERESSDRPFHRKPARPERESSDRPFRGKPTRPERESSDRPFHRKPARPERESSDRPFRGKTTRPERESSDRPDYKIGRRAKPEKKEYDRPFQKHGLVKPGKAPEELIRLNKYIANAGICSRREADVLIQSGVISVNGKPVTELGFKVSRADRVQYGDQTLNTEKLRYVLLNKPKGFITTMDDPELRRTVMGLVEKACKERIYPVGRLDRNTTGLLLFTNDGEMAKKLMHPKYGIRKIYHVVLDRNLTKADMQMISGGIELEDGPVRVDEIEYIEGAKDHKEVGIQLHSGQNRVVRRIFESLGYKVEKLDRVSFAGLTKKNLPRGEWRFLSEMEINMLKMIH